MRGQIRNGPLSANLWKRRPPPEFLPCSQIIPRSLPKQPRRQIPKSQFVWLPAEQTYVCPQGHRLNQISREQRRRAEERSVELTTYRCPKEHCQACPLVKRCTGSAHGRTIKRNEHEDLIMAHQAKMNTPEAKAIYRQRGQTVELRFADAKTHRGLRRFSGRGLERARSKSASGCCRTICWLPGRPVSEKPPGAKMERLARTPLKSGTISQCRGIALVRRDHFSRGHFTPGMGSGLSNTFI